ncbi:MAG: GTPase Era [Alphaproteobacteria bacterium]|nr:GTPase Era [Alphaproteobacteria bacterium]
MTRCGVVAFLGASNVGKSTLLNRLVGQKVSIVSPKVQTTRSKIRGIAVYGDTQLIFIDTPGVFKPRKRLERAMVSAAWDEALDADVRLVVIDAQQKIDDNTQAILQKLPEKSALVVLNKIDLIEKAALLPLINALKDIPSVDEIFCISAQTGENVDQLLQALVKRMPTAPFMYPEDQVSDLPQRLFAAEITREKIFYLLRQELPYSIAVATTGWSESDEAVRIEQTIFVERTGQKAIVIGKKGAMLAKIGSAARLAMTKAFGKTVHLFLLVKVKENWADDPERYKEWGLDFNAKN